jgi:hypothetical protein
MLPGIAEGQKASASSGKQFRLLCPGKNPPPRKKDLTAKRGKATLNVQKAAGNLRPFLCRLPKKRRKKEYGPDE